MDKDYEPSKKYSTHDFDNLEMPYKFRDFCQDDYAEYLYCRRARPNTLENNIMYFLPFSEYFTNCKILREQWMSCQDYREK